MSYKFLVIGKGHSLPFERCYNLLFSLERIQQYLVIEQEPRPITNKEPPAYWPASGALSVDGLSARYSVDGPDVLRDLSFEVKSGERIGIGRYH